MALSQGALRNRPAPSVRNLLRPTEPWFSSDMGVSFGATELYSTAIPGLTAALPFGARWCRITFNGYNADLYGISAYDSLVNAAIALGYTIQGCLAFVPMSNSSAPLSVQQSDPATASHYVPASFTTWSSWVTSVVTRYKTQIKYWECWNEPDGSFWQPSNTDTVSFAHLQAVTYQAVKAVDNTMQVMLGSMAGAGTNWNSSFFANVWADATYPAGTYCDLVGLHFYDYSRLPTLVSSMKSTMGASVKPIWSNEFGYPSDPRQQSTSGYQLGLVSQRQWAKDAIAAAKAQGIAKVFWFEVMESRDAATMISQSIPRYALLDYECGVKR